MPERHYCHWSIGVKRMTNRRSTSIPTSLTWSSLSLPQKQGLITVLALLVQRRMAKQCAIAGGKIEQPPPKGGGFRVPTESRAWDLKSTY